MALDEVIAAMSAVLGPPDRTGEFRGNHFASWGEVESLPGVDVYVKREGTLAVDLWLEHKPVSLQLSEGPESLPNVRDGRRLDSAAAVLAYSGCVYPLRVPLAVAVELAQMAQMAVKQ